MSVEAPNTVEETPVTATPETSEIKKAAVAVPETEQPSETSHNVVGGEPAAVPAKENLHDQVQSPGEVVVEAKPASEGVLGYKEPGLLKLLKGYQKHHFWFGHEAVKPESLTSYIRSDKSVSAHYNAAWAQETGKGVLFYSKREEDKATPAGLIMLSDVSKITKEGETEFQFKEAHHYHKFQATNSAERDSWLVALEKQSEEAKAAKEGVIGSEGYKKHLDAYKAAPALAAPVVGARSTEPKKSLDASTATAAAGTTNGIASHDGAVAEEEKHNETLKREKADGRSRSRGNRKSFFGGLLDKKEKTDENKELKKEEKAEEKAEKKEVKKEVKEEKKHEAVEKKEEAKATHDSTKAKEAAEAAAVTVVPGAAVAAEKHDDKEERSTATHTTEKKAKRGSVFGGIFGKKNATGPDAEKTETEASPAVPAKDTDVPPVSETAPKIEKPIEQKPLDTAAVVAPVDTVQTPAAVEEPVTKDKPTTPTETTATPKQQKEGGGFLGFIKKTESKLAGKKEQKAEAKEEKAAEEVTKDPVAAAAVEPTTETPAATTGEDRPTNPQRRSSLMERFGTQKRKVNKTSETETAPAEAKREKSPLPSKVAGLFRKPSKAVKPTEEKSAETNGLTTDHSEAAAIPETTETATETKPTVTAPETYDSAVAGDVVPNDLNPTVHDTVTATPEVKASA